MTPAANFKCPNCGGGLQEPDAHLPALECERCAGVVEVVGGGGA